MKPVASKDEWCPFWKRSCDKVCHTCPMWVDVQLEGGTKWACAFAWQTPYQHGALTRLDGVQAAVETLRNQFAAFKDSILNLVGMLGGVQHQLSQIPRDGGRLTEEKPRPGPGEDTSV